MNTNRDHTSVTFPKEEAPRPALYDIPAANNSHLQATISKRRKNLRARRDRRLQRAVSTLAPPCLSAQAVETAPPKSSPVLSARGTLIRVRDGNGFKYYFQPYGQDRSFELGDLTKCDHCSNRCMLGNSDSTHVCSLQAEAITTEDGARCT
jgi:hypothetical protein